MGFTTLWSKVDISGNEFTTFAITLPDTDICNPTPHTEGAAYIRHATGFALNTSTPGPPPHSSAIDFGYYAIYPSGYGSSYAAS